MMLKEFKAVIFDMDGLLLDTERLGRLAWEQAASDLELSLPDGFYDRLIGRSIRDIHLQLREDLGEGFPLDAYMARANAHYHRLIHESTPPVKEGVFELLGFLDEFLFPRAVATSSAAPKAQDKLRSTGILPFFEHVITGDLVRQGKPAPDIFRLAAARLGVAPDACLVLEDSENGVRAAAAAGMRVIMVPDELKPSAEVRSLAWRVEPSLRHVLQFLRSSAGTGSPVHPEPRTGPVLRTQPAEGPPPSPEGCPKTGNPISRSPGSPPREDSPADGPAALWEANAPAWIHLTRAGADLYRDWVNSPAFFALLPDVRGALGLDIGCGEGHNTRLAAKRGARMQAVDLTPALVEAAEEEERVRPLGIRYQVADGRTLPYPAETFDFVMSTMALMDMPDLGTVLRGIYRVLRPGGFLQFSISHPCTDLRERRWVLSTDGRREALALGGYFEPRCGEVSTWRFSHPEANAWPPFAIATYHRTLSGWLNAVTDAGLSIECLREPKPDEAALRAHPELMDCAIMPYFLHLRARKTGPTPHQAFPEHPAQSERRM